MKIAVKVLKMIGIAVLVIVVLLAILIFRIFTAPMVPKDYTKTVKTGGAIEAAYMAAGQPWEWPDMPMCSVSTF